jgi:hypothetical protein
VISKLCNCRRKKDGLLVSTDDKIEINGAGKYIEVNGAGKYTLYNTSRELPKASPSAKYKMIRLEIKAYDNDILLTTVPRPSAKEIYRQGSLDLIRNSNSTNQNL